MCPVRTFRLLACFLVTSPLQGQGEQLKLRLDLGYRSLFNASGSQDLYRSQINLGEGPKLFAADLYWVLPEGSNRFLDTLQVRLNNWGGEPYNSGQLILKKVGAYRFQLDYWTAQYFSTVPSLANPFFEEGSFLSQRRFDISRRQFRLRFDLRPRSKIAPFVLFQRGTRQGPVQTTLAAEGDEFSISSETDIDSNDFLFGTILRPVKNLNLVLQQGFRFFRDQSRFSSSGFQEGNATRLVFGEPIFLDGLTSSREVDATIPFSTAVATWRPFPQFSIRGKAAYSLADFNSRYSEEISGNFFSFPPLGIFYPRRTQDAMGAVKRPAFHGDFSADWEPHWRLRIQERFYTRRWHNSANAHLETIFFDADPVLGPEPSERFEQTIQSDQFSSLDLESQELLGLVYLTRRFFVRGGHRHQSKEATLGAETFSWNRNVLLLGLAFSHSRNNRVSVDFEKGFTENPIQRIDVVDFNRVRLRGSFSPWSALRMGGSLNLSENSNDVLEIDLETWDREYGVQVEYVPNNQISLNADYRRTDFRHDLSILVPQTFSIDRSFFSERGDYGGAYLSLALHQRVRFNLGYSFWDTLGTFALSSHRPMASLQITLPEGVEIYGQWNSFDYAERTALFPQQYQSQHLTLGLRLRLGE